MHAPVVVVALLLVTAAVPAVSVPDRGVPSTVDGTELASSGTGPGDPRSVDADRRVGSGATTDAPADRPRIVAAYPDPVARNDAGEFVVIALPPGADPATFSLTDGRRTAALGNATAGARVAVTADSAMVRDLTDRPVAEADLPALANDGEQLRLLRNGTAVDTAVYRDSREGEVLSWGPNGSALSWRPLGATDREPVRAEGGRVRVFALPDAPGVPLSVLHDADERVLLAGYTVTSERVADALVRAHRRGVTVRVLVEGAPVGGRTAREADLLDRLVAAGIEVRAMGGPRARYDYHHAKYAVVDDRALVLTENWKPAGTGGNGSRGWGVVTGQPAVVDGLVETFRADAGWHDARPWAAFKRGRTFERGERAVGDYPTRFEPAAVRVNRTTLLLAPDNAQSALVARLDGAREGVDVVQVTVGDWSDPLVRALRRAADRGVRVRLLLSGAWYVREDNERLAQRFRDWADDRDASLSVRLADPGGRYEKIHAKGAVIDDDTVVVGSLNWNDAAATSNREVVVLLSGREAAAYYGRVFAADWRGGSPRLPVGLVAAVAGLVVLAWIVARRIEFEGDDTAGVDPR